MKAGDAIKPARSAAIYALKHFVNVDKQHVIRAETLSRPPINTNYLVFNIVALSFILALRIAFSFRKAHSTQIKPA